MNRPHINSTIRRNRYHRWKPFNDTPMCNIPLNLIALFCSLIRQETLTYGRELATLNDSVTQVQPVHCNEMEKAQHNN